jgi:hypothetical protein
MTRRGGAGKGSGSKGCGGAEHGQTCTNHAGAWLPGQNLKVQLESAVQLG